MNNILSNIRLPWLIFTLIIFAILVKLGLWQSARAIEKEHRLNHIAQMSDQKALSLTQVLALPISDVNDLPIVLEGEFDNQKQFFLDNQPNNGRLGYRVYQVFSVNKQSLLINLGWVQGSINRQELPQVPLINGYHKISGHLRIIEPGIMLMEQKFEQNQWPLRVQQIELDKFSQVIGKELLPFVVYLDKKDNLGYIKNWQPIVMSPDKHWGYAFQWYSLAVAWVILMFWASIKFSPKKDQK